MRGLLSIIILQTVLLSSASGARAAAFCPHLAAAQNSHACCPHAQAGRMDGMSELEAMPDMEGAVTEPFGISSEVGEQIALTVPAPNCPHCLSHSTPSAPGLAIGSTPQTKQEMNHAPPVRAQSFSFCGAPSELLVNARQNAPPGSGLTQRHKLISVFRI